MPRIDREELEKFISRSLVAAGSLPEDAEIVASVLGEADVRGVYSHGVNRLEMYVHELEAGDVDPEIRPEIVAEGPAVATVDGHNAQGMVVGTYCMQIAINKARETGVGWVVARGSNHYGIAGYYAMMASRSGMVGLSFTNTSPLVHPTRSARPAIGTNPISCAVPAAGDPFVLDMATSTVPIGKVEVQHMKGEPVPENWGVDSDGRPTTMADQILDGGGLLPLGGGETTAGYKGYGLGAMVEIFCGVLAGANFGLDIPPWRSGRERPANLGQCFIAVDPSRFGSGFEGNMTSYLEQLRSLPAVPGSGPVLVPGDPERDAEIRQSAAGIEIHQNLRDSLQQLATRLGVEPPIWRK